jgi:hypothetical protein
MRYASAGGTSPIGSRSRRLLNQSTHSNVANSTAGGARISQGFVEGAPRLARSNDLCTRAGPIRSSVQYVRSVRNRLTRHQERTHLSALMFMATREGLATSMATIAFKIASRAASNPRIAPSRPGIPRPTPPEIGDRDELPVGA